MLQRPGDEEAEALRRATAPGGAVQLLAGGWRRGGPGGFPLAYDRRSRSAFLGEGPQKPLVSYRFVQRTAGAATISADMTDRSLCFIRFAKGARSAVQALGRHVRREAGELRHVDPARSSDNRLLVGDSWRPEDAVEAHLEATGAKVRKNTEKPFVTVLCGASPQWFGGKDGAWDQDRVDAWIAATLDHLQERFGADLVWANVDLDETTPHVNAVVVPVHQPPPTKRGRQRAPEVSPRQAFRGRKSFAAEQDGYAAALAPLGIHRGQRGSSAQHESPQAWGLRKGREAAMEVEEARQAQAAGVASQEAAAAAVEASAAAHEAVGAGALEVDEFEKDGRSGWQGTCPPDVDPERGRSAWQGVCALPTRMKRAVMGSLCRLTGVVRSAAEDRRQAAKERAEADQARQLARTRLGQVEGLHERAEGFVKGVSEARALEHQRAQAARQGRRINELG